MHVMRDRERTEMDNFTQGIKLARELLKLLVYYQ